MKDYVLKRSPFDRNRMLKIGKNILDEATQDRDFALEAHQYFRRMVERSEDTDNDAKRLMVECLKLAQSSKNSSIKALSLMIKLEELEESSSKEGGSSAISFTDLESLANEKR